MKLYLLPGVFANPVRKLLCPDITTLAMMRTSLTDQHFITIFQMIQSFCSTYLYFQLAFVACKKNGK